MSHELNRRMADTCSSEPQFSIENIAWIAAIPNADAGEVPDWLCDCCENPLYVFPELGDAIDEDSDWDEVIAAARNAGKLGFLVQADVPVLRRESHRVLSKVFTVYVDSLDMLPEALKNAAKEIGTSKSEQAALAILMAPIS